LNRVEQFWAEFSAWSQKTFGTDTECGPLGAARHLEKESKEVQQSLQRLARIEGVWLPGFEHEHLKEEIADCLFLVFDTARRSGLTLDTLLDQAFRKLEINRSRRWQKPTSDDQPVEHVR
jgi:NTP pyrophosphatase (non-canonical NTP hydrolase)